MKRIISLLLIILVTISLIGCKSINEVDEDKVKDVSDKITEVIIDSMGKEKAERQESHTINAENLNTFNIKSSVGDINIKTHESNDAIINLNISAHSSSKDKSQELVDEFNYSVEENFNSIDIDTTFKDKDKILEDKNVSTDLIISVPTNIENIIISLNVGDVYIKNVNGKFEVSNNVGEISIENSNASYDIKTNVGEIILSESVAIERSEFVTNTGDIRLSFSDIKDAESIKAVTDVGDIEITIPDDSSYEAEINEFMEKERTESNKDRRTKIEIKTGVGSIDFN